MRSGEVVGNRYELEDQLGSGAHGVVWSAFDRRLKRTVALKRPHSAYGEAERKVFREEAEHAARLHHPNVITVFDTVDSDDCWLVMEYLPSTSLDRVLACDGPLPPARAARIGTQIADALYCAHSARILHRDVKPGNILIANGDLAKLTDFGISVQRDVTMTEDGKISGTPAYLAPEVANGRPASTASDVFSLGATLFAAVEGSPPFGVGTPDAILARACRGRIADASHAEFLGPVLAEMLDVRPSNRPTAEEVRDRLRGFVHGWTPPGATVPAKPVRAWPRRAPWLTVAVAATAAVVVWQLPSADSPKAHVGAPVTAPADLIGDPRTADPCSLADQNVLNRFGSTAVAPQYGNFNRCDVLVDTSAGQQMDVEVEFTVAEAPEVVRPGVFDVVRNPRNSGKCDRKIPVSDRYDVWVTARLDDLAYDLCTVADTETTAVVAALRRGPLARRPPFAAGSWANLDACALPDHASLAKIPGVDAVHPFADFGNWQCSWSSTLDETTLQISFEQTQPPTARDGTPVRLPGRTAFVKANTDQPKSCTARVVGRGFVDRNGGPLVELLDVTVSGGQPGETFCPVATEVAKQIAPVLPG